MTAVSGLDQDVGGFFDPADPAFLADPHPALRRLREQAPVHRRAGPAGGPAVWYLTRYADVQQALRDPALGRQLDRLPGELAAHHRRRALDPLALLRRNVFNLDPPDHTRLRRLLSPAFGARAVAAIDLSVRRAVTGLLDGLAASGGTADVIAQLALPLPVLVVAQLVGFPDGERATLRRFSDELLRSGNPAQVHRAGLRFAGYLTERIEERRADLGDDLLSRLIRAQGAPDGLSRAELLSSVFQLLLAGDETTVNLIGMAVLELLRHPGQLARLRARPELIDPAVEEVLRYNGPVGHARPSYALDDVRIGGRLIARGDTVVPILIAANRDPEVFAEPDAFEIGRVPNRHLGLGAGVHYCLGAPLARLQARAAVGGLVRRFPGLALATDPAALEWAPDLFLRGPRRLPVLISEY
jgi:cytochrome P450